MSDSEWDIPSNLQPRASDYSFDLEQVLNAVVTLRSYVPDDAFTARTLGPERGGSAVVINESGLLVTIGYLITEAETVATKTLTKHRKLLDQISKDLLEKENITGEEFEAYFKKPAAKKK